MGSASIIEAYIQQLIALKQPITPSILQAIADDVGITKSELDAINLEVQSHLTRGHDYIELGYLDRAIDEFTQATELDPVNLEILHTLASLYTQRYNLDSSTADRQQALLISRRCLELKPNDKEAQALVKSLGRTASSQAISQQGKPNIFILIGFLENIFRPDQLSRRTKTKIALLIVFLQQPIHPLTPAQWAMPMLAIVTGGMAAIGFGLTGDRLPLFSKSLPDTVVEAPAFDPGPNIPVTFNYPGLLIEPRLSRLGEYDGGDYYKLHGIVINDSGQEVRKLSLKVELLDGDGDAIATIDQVAVNNAIIPPGDTRAFQLFQKITPELIRVHVSVTDIEQVELFSLSEQSDGVN
ncbi:MAG: FxLYD domain-containing protein [Cyanobacteria bacterium P01_F01_bin.13]